MKIDSDAHEVIGVMIEIVFVNRMSQSSPFSFKASSLNYY